MIDTHCHLDVNDYPDIEEVIKRMDKHKMIVAGTNLETSQHVLELVSKYENVYGVLGIHPEEVEQYDDSFLTFLKDHLTHPKIVGVGEIGLDYHYTKENASLQKEVFRKQIQLAEQYGKAIVVHSRDAAADTLEILKQEVKNSKVVLHCYGYHIELAKEFIKLGCMFGIGGVITFKNNKKLVEVVKSLDLTHFVLETDSPYLTPEPFRGKRNEPKNVFYVAEKIAQIKEVSVEEVIRITTENAIRQFDLKG